MACGVEPSSSARLEIFERISNASTVISPMFFTLMLNFVVLPTLMSDGLVVSIKIAGVDVTTLFFTG